MNLLQTILIVSVCFIISVCAVSVYFETSKEPSEYCKDMLQKRFNELSKEFLKTDSLFNEQMRIGDSVTFNSNMKESIKYSERLTELSKKQKHITAQMEELYYLMYGRN